MLPTAQRRRPPVAFRSGSLLGDASVVVPAGTELRLPTAPSSLPFAGYNTASMLVNSSGMSGGDRLSVAIDTLDPESAAGDVVAGGYGRLVVLDHVQGGVRAGTAYLRRTIGSGGGASATYLPDHDITAPGSEWGSNSGPDGNTPIYPTNWQAISIDDDYGCYMTRDANTVGTYNSFVGLSNAPVGPAPFLVTYKATALFSLPIVGMFLQFGVVDHDGTLWTGPQQNCSFVSTAGFVQYTQVVDQMGSLGNPQIDSVRLNAVVQSAIGRQGYLAISFVQVTTAVSPIVSGVSIPFMHNVLVLDATDSAHDVTVSELEVELSNA